jgi:uncharacterized iron-regulated membrane protein
MVDTIALNAVLAAAVLAAVVGLIAWAIRTQPRDRGQVVNRRRGADRRCEADSHSRSAPGGWTHTDRRRAERRSRDALTA